MLKGVLKLCIVLGLMNVITWNTSARQDHPKLDALFEILRTTDDTKEALGASQLIWRYWSESGSVTTDLMFLRGKQALAEGQLNMGLARFTAVVELDSNFAEGWNKRATVLYLMGDYEGSLSDVYRTLELEPRHFGALSGMGMIFMALEKPKKAISAFRRALMANPHLRNVREQIKRLTNKIQEGKI